MHKHVSVLFIACSKTRSLFTGTISQQNLWGKISHSSTCSTQVFRSFYTSSFVQFNLLLESFTRFTQGLLQLQLIKLIKGI